MEEEKNREDELMPKAELAEEANADREAREQEALLSELELLRKERRDRELSEDGQLGELYRSMREEIYGLMEYAGESGQIIDPETAFHTLLIRNFGDLMQQAERRGEERALRELARLSLATPRALGGNAPTHSVDYASMDNASFDRLVKQALRGELRGKQI